MWKKKWDIIQGRTLYKGGNLVICPRILASNLESRLPIMHHSFAFTPYKASKFMQTSTNYAWGHKYIISLYYECNLIGLIWGNNIFRLRSKHGLGGQSEV